VGVEVMAGGIVETGEPVVVVVAATTFWNFSA
jgi:hypothetical protein